MTLTFLDLYNATAEQAWSMFDADAESAEDFESGLKSAINTALTEIWCSYDFPFRVKDQTFRTKPNVTSYNLPRGNILKKDIDNASYYWIKCDGAFLSYIKDYELLEPSTGKPTGFYVDQNKLYLYPTPDAFYNVQMKYLTLEIGYSEEGDVRFEFLEDGDYLDIPEEYETLFKNVLIKKAMLYAVCAPSDENYPGYLEQYNNAYKTLIKYCTGLDRIQRIVR